MMKKLENIYSFVLSKILLKIVSITLMFFIIFNCVFSSLLVNVSSEDLSKMSSIQKDVFSAIFFVSNTIEKINFSVTSKIIGTTTNNNSSKNNENKTVPCQYNDFIITNLQLNKELSKIQSFNDNSIMVILCVDKTKYFFNTNINKLFCCNICALFLLLALMFFSSIKKIYYDNKIKNIYRIKPTVI